ncbi:MAG TPA: hypothetical protein VI911_11410 [Patescibacteria group bacterium]|nr:hypothetical protein [Patescibacteria group bacterium]
MGLFDKAQDWVNNQLGFNDSSSKEKSTGISAQVEPWDINKSKKEESFFPANFIDGKRWDRVYPYRLMVIDIRTKRVITSEGGTMRPMDVDTSYFQHGTDFSLTQTMTQSLGWIVDLPITPQQLSITDQFAINTSATMRGVVEEHNGVKFKLISVQGTTGIWPNRPTQGAKLKSPTILGSLFGGTFEALTGVVQGIKQVQSAFTGQHPNRLADAASPQSTGSLTETGYYKAHLMAQFFERYAQEKKKAVNKHWRLVFNIPKQNQSFIVTPLTFNWNQNQQRPNEVIFSFQLKAWKRVDISTNETGVKAELPDLSPNALQRIITGINGARATLAASMNLLRAVRSDFRKPLDILRQTALAVKDLGGLAFAVVDLPSSIIGDYKSSIKESLSITKNAFKRGVDNGGNRVSTGNSISSIGINIKTQSLTAGAGAAVNAIVSESNRFEGLSTQAVADGALGLEASQSLQTSALDSVFENPEENFELFNSVSLDDLILTPQQQALVDNELEIIRLTTVNDHRESRNELEKLMNDLSNYFGAGNQTYSDVYGLPDPKERIIPMTLEENEILESLMEAIQSYDLLIATKEWDDNKIESPLEYVGGLANEAGINFEQYTSKYLAPVPFGLTIEEIAARYLGNPDRWIEIVTLNNLRSPYIDEEGFYYNLLSNGEGRQITVDDSLNQLYIGQNIVLSSNTVPAFIRKIINVEKISDTNYLITVDGLDNLDNLTTAGAAKLQGYLPGTANSQNQIYIPINTPAEEDDRTFEIPYLDEKHLTKLSKVDWLLTDQGDLAINSVGDLRLSNGLTNLIQALKLKIKIKKGTLLRHLDYGLGLEHGMSVADIENGEIIKALNKMIEDDPRFDSIERITIKLVGPTLAIDMAVKLANQSGILPINFDVNL